MAIFSTINSLSSKIFGIDLIAALTVSLTAAASVLLIGQQIKPGGWVALLIPLILTHYITKSLSADIRIIILALAILGITEITTDIGYSHMIITSILLTLAVFLPYIISNKWLGKKTIDFHIGRPTEWSRKQVYYILFTAFLAYLLLPFYLKSTGVYHNWPSTSDFSGLIRLFIGTNGLGIWDELFFVVVVLGLLKHHMKFWFANMTQAIMWTAFLYELGFRSWGPILVFIFALLQGYVYKKTHSISYVVTIHLTVDLVLYLALVNSHHPNLFNIFLY